MCSSKIQCSRRPSARSAHLDEDILHNINTFMFAGSDATSLALMWSAFLLAKHPAFQTRLRNELLSVAPAAEELESLHQTLSNLLYLYNVSRESLRLIPPVHSSLRVAMQDDEIPTSYPVHYRTKNGFEAQRTSVFVPKGSFVHVAVEGFNLDTKIWGDVIRSSSRFSLDWANWSWSWPMAWCSACSAWLAFEPVNILCRPLCHRIHSRCNFWQKVQSCLGMRFSMIKICIFFWRTLFELTEESVDGQTVCPRLAEVITCNADVWCHPVPYQSCL